MRFAVLLLALSALAFVTGQNKIRTIRCYWGKCIVFQRGWKKCVPNEVCGDDEKNCEKKCILEHTEPQIYCPYDAGCPQKHKSGSCSKDFFGWKCSTTSTCSPGTDGCEKACLPQDAKEEKKGFFSFIPFFGDVLDRIPIVNKVFSTE